MSVHTKAVVEFMLIKVEDAFVDLMDGNITQKEFDRIHKTLEKYLDKYFPQQQQGETK